MAGQRAGFACCGRCAGPEAAARAARRRLLRAAVFPRPGSGAPGADGARPDEPEGRAGPDVIRGGAAATRANGVVGPVRAVTGTLLDVTPRVLVISMSNGSQRIVLAPGATVWRGGPAEAGQLRPGEHVVARLLPGRRDVAGKVWASIGRVAGTITGWDSGRLLVDEGAIKERSAVIIAPGAVNRIRVRFPQLEPGNLIDVIGLRRGAELEALLPATAQPAYLAASVAGGPAATKTAAAGRISGSATWHEPVQPGEQARGIAYPAIDPAAGCAEPAAAAAGCTRLPYLAVGSMLLVRNECTGTARVLPVTGCGAVARLFHDRCLTCGTSPRGRVADLTLASFVELGGEPERGCFNATIAAGW